MRPPIKTLATSPGIGMGRAFIYRDTDMQIDKKSIESEEREILRFLEAIEQAKSQIDIIYAKSYDKLGKEKANIFLAHKMMLEDPEFIGEVERKIRNEKINAEWAVNEISNQFIAVFEKIQDEYLKSRVMDLKDVTRRVLMILLKIGNLEISSIEENSIIIAKDLTPTDTAEMDRDKVKGFITELGGRNSHSSIIARAMNIPAITGAKDILEFVKSGDYLIIDGLTGDIIINPSEEEKILYRKKQEDLIEKKIKLKALIGAESISKDGYRVEISGNIGNVEDIDEIIENGGDGVGLFRTEYIYMNRDSLPLEEEQFHIYKSAAEKLKGKAIVIRTLDIGGDKEIPYLNLPEEMNPFLGYRAIRISLDKRDIFKTQLRAILRASHYGNIKIMFPMISSIEELRDAKTILKETKIELESKDIEYNNDIEIGIMVEVPGVAIHSKAFAKEVDFFSIGTNDLIQYTVAVDRGNQNIAHLYSQYHPGVLRLIKMTIENGHKAGIWISMCGEMAGEEKLIPLLLAMGLDKLSMNASSILKSKDLIRNTCINEIKEKLEEIIELPTSEDVEKALGQISKVNKP